MEGRDGDSTRGAAFRYSLYGWVVSSDRALPYLISAPQNGGPPDILVRFAPVVPTKTEPVATVRDLRIYSDTSAIYRPIPDLCFLIENGNSITVDARATLDEAALQAVLLGPPMAWLCHQRRQPPLHASAVQIGDYAVALAGNSGAGKSTTARALIARGHGLLADDQTIIDPEDAIVHPGYPSIKLWAGSARHAGDVLRPEHRIDKQLDKFHIPLPRAFRGRPARLGLIVVLAVDRKVHSPRLQPMGLREAAALLQHFIFRADAGRALDGGRRGFEWTVALARKVDLMRLWRPDDMSVLADTCAQIERAVETTVARRSVE